MRWTPGDRGNIDDMRGRSGGAAVPLGIGGFFVLLVLSWVSGTNLFSLLGTGSPPSQTTGTSGQVTSSPAEERLVDFVDAVTKDVQDTWESTLGARYRRTRVVLFRDAIDSGVADGPLSIRTRGARSGDAGEAIRAAAAIGDDRLQKMATGRVIPERFTHGSSAQRVEWFRRGMDSGDPRACTSSAATTR